MEVLSSLAVQGVRTSAFAALAALSFYFVLDTVGLETGPLRPDVMILSLVTAIFIAATVFIYLSETPFAYYTLMVFVVAPFTVFVREYYLYGPAGTTSPVTFWFIAFILVALLLGGGAGASIRAFAARPSAQSE